MLPDQLRTVAIIGSGVMGQGIAQLCATSGFNVKLYDTSQPAVDRAMTAIGANLAALESKGKLNERAVVVSSRVSAATSLNELRADLFIEAIVEQLKPKQDLFAAIEATNPGAILATNTSTFPVTVVGEKVKDQSLVVGLHFFNPATVMKLVEVIAGNQTSSETLSVAKAFAGRLGKTAALVKDSPGFIVNRVARPYYVESLRLLEEGNATHDAVDRLLRATGFRMGPFELMDVIGIDTNLAVTTSLYHAFGEAPRFTPSRIQQEKVAQGHWGRKSGKGFYDYSKP